MVIFNSFLYVYQRVPSKLSSSIPGFLWAVHQTSLGMFRQELPHPNLEIGVVVASRAIHLLQVALTSNGSENGGLAGLTLKLW